MSPTLLSSRQRPNCTHSERRAPVRSMGSSDPPPCSNCQRTARPWRQAVERVPVALVGIAREERGGARSSSRSARTSQRKQTPAGRRTQVRTALWSDTNPSDRGTFDRGFRRRGARARAGLFGTAAGGHVNSTARFDSIGWATGRLVATAMGGSWPRALGCASVSRAGSAATPVARPAHAA